MDGARPPAGLRFGIALVVAAGAAVGGAFAYHAARAGSLLLAFEVAFWVTAAFVFFAAIYNFAGGGGFVGDRYSTRYEPPRPAADEPIGDFAVFLVLAGALAAIGAAIKYL